MVTATTYDLNNRLKTTAFTGGPSTLTYTYDAGGYLLNRKRSSQEYNARNQPPPPSTP